MCLLKEFKNKDRKIIIENKFEIELMRWNFRGIDRWLIRNVLKWD